MPGSHMATMMSRPQVGIERLPVRRPSVKDPKEAMNCKSCRKRKIKCNRLKPSCEACRVFRCACIYDAVPKKRGPKTDVLEALLKRVNGLEKRLKDDKSDSSDAVEAAEVASVARAIKESVSNLNSTDGVEEQDIAVESTKQEQHEPARRRLSIPKRPGPLAAVVAAQQPQRPARLLPVQQANVVEPQSFAASLIDTYFARLHGKPHHILDEPATRQRLRVGQLPRHLVNAIFAVSARHAPHLCGGHDAAVRCSQEYAVQARSSIDLDEPTIEHLQTLLLLAMASFQAGRGKKSYMLLSHAVSMALALNLHRELSMQLKIPSSEREGRRKLFWTCYIMDRFNVTGSKRPCLISDDAVYLRLPAWSPTGSRLTLDGSFFSNGLSLPCAVGLSSAGQGSAAMLVEIVRVLGVANRYMAAGGAKGDAHFPWHVQSTLSCIRSELDSWATSTSDAFTSNEALFGQPDSTTLVLSKLIYHLIHCLVYRPFLPVDLAELASAGQHPSWQIDATNVCFLHANAITELVEIGKNQSITDWPSFVGYCVCTAGTIHVHGAHYVSTQDNEVFSNSTELLFCEWAQLLGLRSVWTGVQHHQETLQAVCASHSQLVRSLVTNPMRFPPVFQMEDFFDRYPGYHIESAHLTFADVGLGILHQAAATSYDGFSKGSMMECDYQSAQSIDTTCQLSLSSQCRTQNQLPSSSRRPKRRRTVHGSAHHPKTTSQAPFALREHTSARAHSLDGCHRQGQDYHEQQQLQHTMAFNNQQPKNPRPQAQDQMLASPALSFGFSAGVAQQPQNSLEQNELGQYDPFCGAPAFDQQTSGGFSQSTESAHTDLT